MTRNGAGRAVPRPDATGTLAVLDGIRVAWEWLCADPHPVTVAGTQIAGVADRPVALGELRVLVLDPATGGPVRDAVWAYLVTRSRRDGPTWTVACAGMALPMLAGAYRDCASRALRYGAHRSSGGYEHRDGRGQGGGGRGGGDRAGREDIASEVVTGFVAALATVDIDQSGIASALRWSALRAGLGAMREALDAPIPRPHDQLVADALAAPPPPGADTTGAEPAAAPEPSTQTAVETAGVRGWGSSPPPARSAHPDLVLAAAVADGVISAAEADLIGETRLQRVPLGEIADRTRHTVGALTMSRLRAELRLIDHLLGPDAAAAHTPADVPTRPDLPDQPAAPAGAPGDRSGCTPVDSRSGPRVVARAARRSSQSVSGPISPAGSLASRGGTGRGGGGSGGAASASLSVSGRRRRRTRGARRTESGQVTR